MSGSSDDDAYDRHLTDEEARLARQAALTVRLREAGQDTIFVEALLGVREGELRAMRLHLEPAPASAVTFEMAGDVTEGTAAEPVECEHEAGTEIRFGGTKTPTPSVCRT